MRYNFTIQLIIVLSILVLAPGSVRAAEIRFAAEQMKWAVSVNSADTAAAAPETENAVGENEAAIPAAAEIMVEPTIRVGIFKTAVPVEFTSLFPYSVYEGAVVRGVLPPGQIARLSYNSGTYSFTSPAVSFTSSEYVRLVSDNPDDRFVLLNISRRLTGRRENFNTYRGTLEYLYSPKSDLPYLINELPLELYTAGLTEASNGAAPEYLKALAVAGRTYAYTMLAPRSPSHLFDVYGSTIDQLYLGYNSELSSPNIVAAAQATAGQMVTYEGKPATTNYFSRSNGATKTWGRRGGVEKPWLVSVEAVYDKGKTLLGHGYGMSNYDAAMRASRDGWKYDRLLQYYYTNTLVERLY